MKKLNVVLIGLRNLSRQAVRTGVMMTFSFVLAASMLINDTLQTSMESSVEQTVSRMGADVIVVPKEYSSNYTDALFTGELCSFYFDGAWYDKVANAKGVKLATPQLYIASLAASCCSSAVQLIAFDPESDFIVKPWLDRMKLDRLGKFEVLLGDGLTGNIGESITFFNITLTISGRLERTGTGYDTCAFINFDTAYTMLETPQLRELSIGDRNPESLVSSIMVRTQEGVETNRVARAINYGLKNSPLWAYTANGIVSSVADSVESFSRFTVVLNGLLLFMSIMSILCIFTITIFQRKHEFGVLVTLGATKAKLIAIILTEGLAIGLIGGVSGVVVSGGLMLAFHNGILLSLGIPAFVSELSFYGLTAIKCIVVSLASGLLASIYAIVHISSGEPLSLIQEGNA